MVMPSYLGQGGVELHGGGLVPGGTDHGPLGTRLNREAVPLPEASPPVSMLWLVLELGTAKGPWRTAGSRRSAPSVSPAWC